jgi:hypothetical protein
VPPPEGYDQGLPDSATNLVAQMRRGIFLAVLTRAWHSSKCWGLVWKTANPSGKKPDSKQPNDPAGTTNVLVARRGPTRNIPKSNGSGFYENASLALFIAGDFGFLTLIHSREGPGR